MTRSTRSKFHGASFISTSSATVRGVIVSVAASLLLMTTAQIAQAHSPQSDICKGFDKEGRACTIAKNYAQVKLRAAIVSQKLGIEVQPSRFRDVIARQFINRSDFEEFIKKNPNNPDPYCTYNPKPATWHNWQMTYETEVEVAGREKTPLTESLLLKWNKMALVNTLAENIVIGEVKQFPNFGNNLHQSIALSNVEVGALESIKLNTIRHGRWIFARNETTGLKWSPMVCAEDLPAQVMLGDTGPDCHRIFEDAKKILAHEPDNQFWKATLDLENKPWDFKNHGKEYWFTYACWPRKTQAQIEAEKASAASGVKSCGMISYPDPKLVEVALNNLIVQVNRYISKNKLSVDPIAFASLMQRRFVALHPFNKGNGRVSRWVMDYITIAHALPPIIVKDMDMDLSVPDSVYVEDAYAGSQEALDRMNACLKVYEDPNYDANAVKNSVCAMVESTVDKQTAHTCN